MEVERVVVAENNQLVLCIKLTQEEAAYVNKRRYIGFDFYIDLSFRERVRRHKTWKRKWDSIVCFTKYIWKAK